MTVVALAISLRCCVIATEDGVIARLPSGRTRRLDWPEIHHFEMRGYRRGLGAWTIDGRWERVLTYGSFDTSAQSILTQLEQYRWLRQRQLGLA